MSAPLFSIPTKACSPAFVGMSSRRRLSWATQLFSVFVVAALAVAETHAAPAPVPASPFLNDHAGARIDGFHEENLEPADTVNRAASTAVAAGADALSRSPRALYNSGVNYGTGTANRRNGIIGAPIVDPITGANVISYTAAAATPSYLLGNNYAFPFGGGVGGFPGLYGGFGSSYLSPLLSGGAAGFGLGSFGGGYPPISSPYLYSQFSPYAGYGLGNPFIGSGLGGGFYGGLGLFGRR